MKVTLTILFLTSLIANVALALRMADTSTELQTGSVEFTRDTVTANPKAQPVPNPATPAASKAEVLLALEREYLAAADAAAGKYWLGGSAYERDSRSARQDAYASIRAELERIYGQAAERDPAFAPLFRPLDPVYSFLTSAEQLSVQQLKLERDAGLRQETRRGGGLSGPPSPARLQADEAYQNGLAALLDRDTLFEFQLRDSATARQLRDADIDFTEEEFRQVFRVMQELGHGGADIERMLAARESLRGILGSHRFAALWAARDPIFAQLQDTARRLDLSQAQLLSVYEILTDFQDRKMQAAQLSTLDPARAAAQSVSLRDDERRAIANLIGQQSADEIMRARAVESLQLFR